MDEALASLRSATAGLPVAAVLVANGGWQPGEPVTRHFDDVVRCELAGLGLARNLGVLQARSPWVSFFDTDDVLERGYVQGLLGAIESAQQQRRPCFFNGTAFIDADSRPLGVPRSAPHRHPALALALRHPFTGATLTIRRDAFIALGGYKWGGYAEDYELSIRLVQRHGLPQVHHANHYRYRLHGAAMSGNGRAKIAGVLAVQLHAAVSGRGRRYWLGAGVSVARLAVARTGQALRLLAGPRRGAAR